MSERTRDAIVADAIIDEINAATWTQAFKADRKYVASLDKVDTRTLWVQVQANGSSETQITRKHRRILHAITITVRRNVDPKNKAAVDALGAFMQSLADYYRVPRGKHKVPGTQATVIDVVLTPANPDELDTNLQFFAGLSLAVQEVIVSG